MSSASRRKQAAAGLSIGSNTLLVLAKLAVGLRTGSVSVLSEAAHSATDLLASAIAFISVRFSDHPPDEEHPYGHGKLESVSGFLEALLIMGAALYIVVEAVHKLRAPAAETPPVGAALLVMAISIAVNLGVSAYLRKVARETDSQALLADAEHLTTDVLTSVAVLVGLALVHFTGLAWLDPATGLLVACMIARTGWQLTSQSVHTLLDTRLPDEEEARIRAILDGDPRVLGYHKLRTRKSGSLRLVDLHVQMEDECSLLVAHTTVEELEDAIRRTLGDAIVSIHPEPFLDEVLHQLQDHGLPPHQVNQKLAPGLS